jgi:phospholipase C
MSGMTRRQLLQAGAGAGMLALAADPLVQLAMAKKLPPGNLSNIEHVVIFIQENRSFDHYFGMMPGVRGYNDKSVPKSRFEQAGYNEPGFEGMLLPYHAPSAMGAGKICFPDITHSWVPQHESWNNGQMDQFVKTHIADDGQAAGVATMAYYEREDVPFYWSLAENYTLCDHYHCSVIGPTYPNRLYSMTATLDPNGENGGPLVKTESNTEFLKGKFTWETMPEALSAHGVSWKVYNGLEAGFEDNVLEFFKNFQTNSTLKKLGLEPLFPNDFVTDLKHNELPQVTWINASLPSTEHPGNSSAKVGEFVLQNIIKSLHKHKVWEKTALFVTWDENGGFFDHVAPPVAPEGTPNEYLTKPDITGDDGGIKGPIGLGFRVPLLVLGPYARGGFLCSETFDHTSLLRFLETRFGVEVPNLSQWRRENTGDLTKAFNFVQGDTSKGKLPKITVTEKEVTEGACEDHEALKPPANSFPQQPEGGHWRTPSG